MKFLSLILACLMVLCVFAGCNDTPKTTKPTTPKKETPVDPGDDPSGEDGIEYTEMYYDDRVNVRDLIGFTSSDIEIKDQKVTSKVIGTDEADSDVIIYEEKTGRIIAVGTGTAVLVVGETEFNIRVSAAPITLAIITGHSQGYGSQGSKNQTVVCEPGQAYGTHLLLSSEKWDLDWRDAFKGSTLGYKEADRVSGIDIMTSDGKGASGENKGAGAALAYEWHQLTGEKMWVINCAVGGSSINQWQPGEDYMEYALEAMTMAGNILKNEVEAGHYEYKRMAMFNFSSANLSYNKVEYDDEKLMQWNDAMWKSFYERVTVDIDGDGEIDRPSSMGYVPGWFAARKSFVNEDLPIIYYRAASAEYPHIYIASDLVRLFGTDAGVAANYPKTTYTMQNGGKQTICTTMKQVWAYEEKDPPTHLSQLGYNAIGIDMAHGLYDYVYGTTEETDVNVYIDNGTSHTLVENEFTLSSKGTIQVIVAPKSGNTTDLSFEVTKNLTMDEQFRITAVAGGTGKITIKQGDKVIKTINVIVK